MSLPKTLVKPRLVALILVTSALLPIGGYTLIRTWQATTIDNTPKIMSLGGFDSDGNLVGFTVRIGRRTYTCGGSEGAVSCELAPQRSA